MMHLQLKLSFFVVVFLAKAINVRSVEIKVKAVPPIYTQEIKNISCYEATIPMFFRIELPPLPEKPPKRHIDCSNGSTYTNVNASDSANSNAAQLYCKLEQNFYAVSKHIIKDLRMQRNFLYNRQTTSNSNTTTSLRRKRQAGPIIAATSILAGFLLRPAINKFTGNLFGSDEEWESHYNAIRESVIEEHALLMNFENATHTYTQEMYEILHNISEMLTEEKQDIIWTLHLLANKMHADIMQNAIQACKTKHIPDNLIQANFLKMKLKSLDDTLSKNYSYSLAIGEKEFGKYYKLPIADCIFTPTNAYVTLNIPLKRKNADWKLFEIIHTKYAYGNQICEVYPQEAAYLAVDESSKTNRTVLVTPSVLQHCPLFEHQICMIPAEYTKDSVQSLRCTVGLHRNSSLEEIMKYCSFRCYTNPDEVIITQITDTKIVVTNAKNITYNCINQNVQVIHVEKLGAIELHLDCMCSISINGLRKLPRPFPCLKSRELNKRFNITIPNLWTHDFTLLQTMNDTGLQQHINHNWPWLVPVLNFSKQAAQNYTIPEKAVRSSVFTIEMWLGAITVALLLHITLTFYCFFKIFLAGIINESLTPQTSASSFSSASDKPQHRFRNDLKRTSLYVDDVDEAVSLRNSINKNHKLI